MEKVQIAGMPDCYALIFRRSDLTPKSRDLPLNMVYVVTDLKVPLMEIQAASYVVMFEGTRFHVFKDRGDSLFIKASYFSEERDNVRVIEGRLYTTFPANPEFGIKAGTLVCEPWTEQDNQDGDPEDDVLGMTVTRCGQLFRDIGFFIPETIYKFE